MRATVGYGQRNEATSYRMGSMKALNIKEIMIQDKQNPFPVF